MNTATLTAVDTIQHEMSTALGNPLPDEQRYAKRAGMFLELVKTFTVETQGDFEAATGELRDIKAVWNRMDADRVSFTGPLNEVLGKINARFQPHLKTLASAEVILKAKMSAFLTAEKARAALAQADAERRAETERQELLAKAAALRTESGDSAEADALEQTAAVVIAQAVPVVSSSKRAGLTTPMTVGFELTSLLDLVKHVATDRPDLIVLLQLDEAKVRAMVKMLGLNTTVPGLRVFSKTGITVR